MLLLGFVGMCRGADIVMSLQTNYAAEAILSQGANFSLQRIFSSTQDGLTLSKHARVLLANSRWFKLYYPCIAVIQNSDQPSLELCRHISYLGLGLLQIVNQDHTNQVSNNRSLSSDAIVEIQRDGTQLTIIAVELLKLEAPQSTVWAEAGRPMQRIVLLMNSELAPYLVIIRAQAVNGQPLNAIYRRDLGEALLLAELPFQSVKHLDYAVAQDSQDYKSHYFLARAYYLLADWEEAEYYARRAIALNSATDHSPYRQLGEICEAKEDNDCAIEAYQALLSMKPEDIFAKIRLETLTNEVDP